MNTAMVPAGAYVGVAVENINEGQLMKELNAEISRAVKSLLEYEKETDTKGSVSVSLNIVIEPVKGAKEARAIRTKVSSKIPQRQSISLAKEGNGRLLCQPIGTNDDPHQQTFYDHRGNIMNLDGRERFVDADEPEQKDSIPIAGARRAAQG